MSPPSGGPSPGTYIVLWAVKSSSPPSSSCCSDQIWQSVRRAERARSGAAPGLWCLKRGCWSSGDAFCPWRSFNQLLEDPRLGWLEKVWNKEARGNAARAPGCSGSVSRWQQWYIWVSSVLKGAGRFYLTGGSDWRATLRIDQAAKSILHLLDVIQAACAHQRHRNLPTNCLYDWGKQQKVASQLISF